MICIDPSGRVLLLRWRDPVSERLFWEPPGGGVEAGESDLAAARRELAEETGLLAELSESWAVEVERDFLWGGRRFVGPERFYGLHVPEAGARPAGLTESELSTFSGYGWFSSSQLDSMPDELEPPELPGVVQTLAEMRQNEDSGGPGSGPSTVSGG